MTKVLVGIDGSPRGEQALLWAANMFSPESAQFTLLTAIDPRLKEELKLSREALYEAAQAALNVAERQLCDRCDPARVDCVIVENTAVNALVDAASDHDIVVMGSHYRKSGGSGESHGAKGLRVSLNARVPVAVIPVDWDEEAANKTFMVGISADGSSDAALSWGAHMANAHGDELNLVAAWGLPVLLSRSAEAMGGGLAPVGEQLQQRLDHTVAALAEEYPDLTVHGQAVEGSSPAQVLAKCSSQCGTLVLGSHGYRTLGRVLFGSVTHSMLTSLTVPTVVVPSQK